MKDYFPTMRLWTASLLTLGAVLIQCPAQAQSIGPLKETWNEGKTWQPEGSGRPNRGSSGGNSAPSVSPEEVARQARQQAEADAGYEANKEGGKYYDQGNWDAAIQAYEKAIQNYEEALLRGDSEILRKNLANNRKNLALAKSCKANQEGAKYVKQGNWDAAIQAYEKSLQWDDDKIVRKNLATVKGMKANEEGGKYWDQGNWDAAVQAYEKAIQNYEEALRWGDSEIARKDLATIREGLAVAKGMKASLEGAEYWKQGNWDAAVQAYEKALQNWDDKVIRDNLTHAKEHARLQRERVKQEQERQSRDAVATASIKQSVDRLVTDLGNQSATGGFDSPATGTPRSGGGLDFITDPATVLSKPAVSNTSEPNTEARIQLYSIEQHSKKLKSLSGKGSSDGQATTASELAKEGFDKSTTRGPVNEQTEHAVQNLAQRDRTNPDGDPIVPQQVRNQNPKIAEMERQRDGLKQKRQAASDQIAKIEQDLKTTTDSKTHGELLVKRTEALQNETNLTNQIYTINFNITAEIPKPSQAPIQERNKPNAKTQPTKN